MAWFTAALAWIKSAFDLAAASKYLIYVIILFAGIVPGCTVGQWTAGRKSYKEGYNRGYADGEGGKRKPIFPNIWRMDAPMEGAEPEA